MDMNEVMSEAPMESVVVRDESVSLQTETQGTGSVVQVDCGITANTAATGLGNEENVVNRIHGSMVPFGNLEDHKAFADLIRKVPTTYSLGFFKENDPLVTSVAKFLKYVKRKEVVRSEDQGQCSKICLNLDGQNNVGVPKKRIRMTDRRAILRDKQYGVGAGGRKVVKVSMAKADPISGSSQLPPVLHVEYNIGKDILPKKIPMSKELSMKYIWSQMKRAKEKVGASTSSLLQHVPNGGFKESILGSIPAISKFVFGSTKIDGNLGGDDRKNTSYANVTAGIAEPMQYCPPLVLDSGEKVVMAIPTKCEHCQVFGHSVERCKLKPVTNMDVDGGSDVNCTNGHVDGNAKSLDDSVGGNATKEGDDGFQMVTKKGVKKTKEGAPRSGPNSPVKRVSKGDCSPSKGAGNSSDVKQKDSEVRTPTRKSSNPEASSSGTKDESKKPYGMDTGSNVSKSGSKGGGNEPKNENKGDKKGINTNQEYRGSYQETMKEKEARIIVGWNPGAVDVVTINLTDQLLNCYIKSKDGSQNFYCSFVYGRVKVMQRRALWADLEQFGSIIAQDPWLVVGDFNATLDPAESSSSTSHMSSSIDEFRSCCSNAGIIDITFTGMKFTWNQTPGKTTGLLRKLDRAMCNAEFMASFPKVTAVFLPFYTSDHAPSLIYGCTMFSGVSKMKNLKRPLRKLAHEQGNLTEKVDVLRKELGKIQEAMVVDSSNQSLRAEERAYIQALKSAEIDEELFLRQKAKVEWLAAGDQNSSYFHKAVKGRQAKNRINGIMDMGGNYHVGDKIGEAFVDHFKSYMGCNVPVQRIEHPDSLFTKKLPRQAADHMVRPVTDEEVKSDIFDIDDDKAPGPDGFTSKFFKAAWSTVGPEVCSAVREFFENGKLLNEINATIISLVPKCHTPSNVADFRPIACCNVLYKGITKIICNRLKDSLDLVVSMNQSAFIPGKRGLRQGDPMSPYLFTLVMEVLTLILNRRIREADNFKYHWKCRKLGITNLCFFYDLLIFVNADCDSVKVIKLALEEFSGISGLLPNLSKSTMYFGNVVPNLKAKILRLIPFKEVKSVLASMQVYWASMFLLPIALIEDIERIINKFPWTQTDSSKGKVRVSWNEVCFPKEQGGLELNLYGLKGRSLWEFPDKKDKCWSWRNIMKCRAEVWSHCYSQLGDGSKTSVWFDLWHPLSPLCFFISPREINRAGLSLSLKVSDIIVEGNWAWPEEWDSRFPELFDYVPPLLVDGNVDKVLWCNNEGNLVPFSSKVAFQDFSEVHPIVPWVNLVWFSQSIPRHGFILWLACRQRLLTQDKLLKWDKEDNLLCIFCQQQHDSHTHLFFEAKGCDSGVLYINPSVHALNKRERGSNERRILLLGYNVQLQSVISKLHTSMLIKLQLAAALGKTVIHKDVIVRLLLMFSVDLGWIYNPLICYLVMLPFSHLNVGCYFAFWGWMLLYSLAMHVGWRIVLCSQQAMLINDGQRLLLVSSTWSHWLSLGLLKMNGSWSTTFCKSIVYLDGCPTAATTVNQSFLAGSRIDTTFLAGASNLLLRELYEAADDMFFWDKKEI
ncbi:hypothetical protein SSX86_030178 [Deinandra increscens subsp. villosa]|uniref:Reverse transcriptase domain-containing protein n=1 Tax=Deinandra increscens subsp. villosa TaxID=3103831 RepID=A0AAP0GIT7_9ASTR